VRATEAEVKQIINTTLTVDQVRPFLRAANLIVTSICADAGYGADLLAEIERWLAAHLVAIRDPRASQEDVGIGSVTYQGTTGEGLNHTSYGQQVRLLDYKGLIISASESKMSAVIECIDISEETAT